MVAKRIGYDLDAESKRVVVALKKLKETASPGEAVGTGGKIDVLKVQIARDAILAMHAEGYTPRQIAEAIKSDTFSILPKSITELVRDSETNADNKKADRSNKPQKAKKESSTTKSITAAKRDAKNGEMKSARRENKQPRRGSFDVTPDTPDDEL